MSTSDNVPGRRPASPPSKRPLRPRDAATLVVYDFENGAARILMGRRRMDQVFLPGHYVFPGGRVDKSDARTAIASTLNLDSQANLMMGMGVRASARRAQALALAAIRETFEETGYLVGPGPVPAAAAGTGYQLSWQGIEQAGLMPELDSLIYFCRAVTPPGRPRRYDTRFFAVSRDAVSGPHSEGDGELEDIGWRTLDEIQTLKLPSITRIVLQEIAQLLGARHAAPSSKTDMTALTSPQRAGIPFYFQRNGVFQRVLLSRSASPP